MSNPTLKPFDDEILDVKKQSLYARLKRLFSTDVIVRNVGGKQLKIKDTDNVMFATDRNSLRDRFNRIRSTSYNAHTRDFALSYQAARMDLFRDYDCVGPDTIIPLPDGTLPTIAELAEKYKDKPQERFHVFSYDHKTDSIKLGNAFHPRKKSGGTRMGYKVTVDNGQYVVGSIKHPFLMRNGEYKMIYDLKVGESVMPCNINDDRLYKCLNEADGTFYMISSALEGHHNLSPKIVSIESVGPIDVYDVTVDEYHNFGTNSVFVSNTMDMDPIISSALDIFSEECLTFNETGKMLTVHSNNSNIKEILENLFTDILNVQFNLYSWVRNMAKYGDFYLKLYITPEYGIYMVEPVSSYNVERIENADPYNKRYVKFQLRPTDTAQAEVLENYEMAHFRLLSDSNFAPYGKCQKYDTFISTNNGRKMIKDISIDDKVWTYNLAEDKLELSNVKATICSGEKNIIQINTRHFRNECSYNHPMLVYSDELKYKIAEDIKLGDLIAISKEIPNNPIVSKLKLPEKNTTGFKNIMFEPVTCIKDVGISKTYDIQVESSNSNFIANGIVVHNSMIEGGRRIWKQLSLIEDAMLIHRIMRAPEKRIFYTDIGNIAPNEVDAYMEKMMGKMKKVPYMDEQTGEYNLRFNMQNMVEDYYIPVRGGDSGTKIDTLGGMEWTGTEDVEYLRNKLMAALKIPKAFLSYSEDISGKATLACIVPETQIPLLNGLIKTVKELIDDHNNGIKNYVYSIDEETNSIVSGEIEWAGFTRMNTNVIRVHLDNSKYIDCTSDHKFMTRDGKWIESKDLVAGQSLMPLYRRLKQIGKISEYEQIYNPSNNKWEYTHKLIDNHTNGKILQCSKFGQDDFVCIHHKDFNRFNNIPSNLDRMLWKDHRELHKVNYSYLKKWIDINGYYSKTDEGRKFMSNRSITLQSHLNLRRGYDIKYKNGKFDTRGSLHGKWRKRPLFTHIIDKINAFDRNIDEINTFVGLSKYIGYHTSILREVINLNNYSVTEFLNQYIGFKRGRPNDIKSDFFLSDIKKYKNRYQYIKSHKISYKGYKSILKYTGIDNDILNHKVIKIEILPEKRDTCDITIKKYHNFATSAGVIIHNSMDIRFARTIQRIQRIICSELQKIAIVHLYAQGYRDESLVDFELELTNPSTIFEKEKVEIWAEKVSVATDMIDNKIYSYDWIYKNIFNMSEDDIEEVRAQVVDDAKQKFRFSSIEEDGDDPAQPFKKIGSGDKGEGGGGEDSGGGGGGGGGHGGGGGLPDLKDLEDLGGDEGGPVLGDEGGEGGPGELKETKESKEAKKARENRDQTGDHKASDDGAFGYDPLGDKELHEKPNKNSEGSPKSEIRHNFQDKSPLSLKENGFILKKDIIPKRNVDSSLISSLSKFMSKSSKDIKKELIEEGKGDGSKSIMDERNILPE